MEAFVQVMKALSDPNRVRIVKLLQHRTLCVCELQALLNVAQPTVSKHLKVLESAGLVRSFKDGLWVNYQLADGGASPFAASLLGNLRHWLSDDAELNRLLERLPKVRREDLCRRAPAA